MKILGTLGNYIHLQWNGYLKKNTQRGTYFQEQEKIYNQIKKVETDVLNKYKDAVTDKQIQEFQNDLNIFFGIEGANEIDKNSIFNNDEIKQYINDEVMKHLEQSGIFKNKDISKIFLNTETYDIQRKSAFAEEEKKILQNLKDIKKIYKEIDSSQEDREITKFTENIKELGKLLSQLNKSLKIAKNEINQKKANSHTIEQAINSTLIKELSKFSSQIRKILKQIKEKTISYQEAKDSFSKIPCGNNKNLSLYSAINNFIEMITYTATINRAKGVAIELLIGEMDIVKRAAKIATKTAKNITIEEIKEQIKKESTGILNFEKTQAGDDKSKTVIIRSFYDDKYRERVNELSQTKKISVKNAGDIVITNAGGAQEKVDAYIYLGDDDSANPSGVTAKNYKFTSSKKDRSKKTTIDLVKDSPLINFLQQGLNKTSLDVFGNHLLNLNLNHYAEISEEITYSDEPPSNAESISEMKQNYLSLLNEIIFIKSLTGESIIRLSGTNEKNYATYTINNASVFVINDNTSKMIKVHKVYDIIQACLDSKNSSIKSYIKFSKNLSEIENRIVNGEKEETTRIAKILLDMESIKINAQVSLSYQ